MEYVARGLRPQVPQDYICNSLATKQHSRKMLWKLSYFFFLDISYELPSIIETELVKCLQNTERYE
jgi:hypothetical protein